MDKRTIKRLLKSGTWMLRFDNDGESYNGFRWKPIGEWTEAENFSTEPTCESGGLFGQSPKAAGYCKPGSRLCLCETAGKQIIIDGDKVKVQKARIVAVNEKIPAAFLNTFGGSLYLEGYQHPLQNLTTVGGFLNLRGYPHPLQNLTTVGGSLDLGGYEHPLPGLTSVGGSLDLGGYEHPLPGLTSVGDYLDLEGYPHPLQSLTSVGGYLDLGDYPYPLPGLGR